MSRSDRPGPEARARVQRLSRPQRRWLAGSRGRPGRRGSREAECPLLRPPRQRLVVCASARRLGEHCRQVSRPAASHRGGDQRGIRLGRRQPAPGPGLPKQPRPWGGRRLASFSGQTRLLCVGEPAFCCLSVCLSPAHPPSRPPGTIPRCLARAALPAAPEWSRGAA